MGRCRLEIPAQEEESMGAWGSGSFENDDACDWVADLEENGPSAVREPLTTVADADEDEYLEAPDCSVAIAAAELIAASHDRAATDFPEQAHAWVARNRKSLTAND